MNNSSAEKVCHIRERVAGRIGESRFRTWFDTTTNFVLDGNRLDVRVDNPLVGSWIVSNFMTHLKEATREVLGMEPKIDVHVEHGARELRSTPPAPREEPRHVGSAPRPPRGAGALRGELESFVVGASNQMAFAAVQCVARRPGADFRLLVMHGGCGLGKTHLLHGLCNAVHRNHPTLEWRYLSGEEFTNEFVSALKSSRVDQFRTRFRQVDLLIIDDIHFLANKRGTQEEFLHTFNAIDTCGKTIVLTSDRHPRAIATLSEPLVNRLISGMIVQIDPPDFHTRVEILRRRAAGMNVKLDDSVLELLARRITRNVRELEGALYKLVALASLTREPVDLEMARLAAEDCATPAERPLDTTEIERCVSQYFGLAREAIHSRARDRRISLARGVAMYLVRKHTRLSYPEIGRQMGQKNHSTVLMAVRRIEQVLERSGAVAWRTPSGPKEMSLRDLVAELERSLARSPGTNQ